MVRTPVCVLSLACLVYWLLVLVLVSPLIRRNRWLSRGLPVEHRLDLFGGKLGVVVFQLGVVAVAAGGRQPELFLAGKKLVRAERLGIDAQQLAPPDVALHLRRHHKDARPASDRRLVLSVGRGK